MLTIPEVLDGKPMTNRLGYTWTPPRFGDEEWVWFYNHHGNRKRGKISLVRTGYTRDNSARHTYYIGLPSANPQHAGTWYHLWISEKNVIGLATAGAQ